jgi:hypothetical protein
MKNIKVLTLERFCFVQETKQVIFGWYILQENVLLKCFDSSEKILSQLYSNISILFFEWDVFHFHLDIIYEEIQNHSL